MEKGLDTVKTQASVCRLTESDLKAIGHQDYARQFKHRYDRK